MLENFLQHMNDAHKIGVPHARTSASDGVTASFGEEISSNCQVIRASNVEEHHLAVVAHFGLQKNGNVN